MNQTCQALTIFIVLIFILGAGFYAHRHYTDMSQVPPVGERNNNTGIKILIKALEEQDMEVTLSDDGNGKDGPVPEIAEIKDQESFRLAFITAQGLPLKVLEFDNPADARRAYEKLSGIKRVNQVTCLAGGSFVILVRHWRYKFYRDRIIGTEEILVDPSTMEKIEKALAQLPSGDGGEK